MTDSQTGDPTPSLPIGPLPPLPPQTGGSIERAALARQLAALDEQQRPLIRRWINLKDELHILRSGLGKVRHRGPSHQSATDIAPLVAENEKLHLAVGAFEKQIRAVRERLEDMDLSRRIRGAFNADLGSSGGAAGNAGAAGPGGGGGGVGAPSLPSPGASAPAPPVLTRPRAGASIIGGRAPEQLRANGPLRAGQGLTAQQPGARAGAQGSDAEGAMDSINLGQLKAQGPPPQVKQKTQLFDYRYDDTDTTMNELDEFYPYVEMPRVAQNPELFKGSFDGDWTAAPARRRRAYMELQLERMESRSPDIRRLAQGRLLYLLQGCFAETTSTEDHLHWVIENAKTLRQVDGVATLVIGLRDAARRYSESADPADKPMSSSGNPQPSHVDPYDDRSAELMDLLAMLYFVIESCRTDESFGDELMAMTPPLPLVMFQMIAGLKDRLPKGYPVKKVLLLMWKTLLACLGGMKEVGKARVLARELACLPPADKNFTKATPMDISSFRRDTSTKYPTFAPPASSTISIPNEKLADGIKPLPPRVNYHTTEMPSLPRPAQAPPPPTQPAPAATQNPLPGTPAPTPPASPQVKAKKQQYQTDQTKPYIFPFSRSAIPSIGGYLVPHAIAEADRLYHRHAYISLGLYQLWQTRDECLREERGLGLGGLIGFSQLAIGEDEADEAEEEARRRDWQFEMEEMEAEAAGDEKRVQSARERRAANKRLHRVDIIYKNTLPIMQSCVIVLLKLLLATVTGPGSTPAQMAQTNLPPGAASPTAEHPPPPPIPPPTREEVDIVRHREITSKAVSAILILILKWFKASHILKFHYFAQLLFDSNCLLLVLKMFGLGDVAVTVQAKNECEDWGFFKYCNLHCSRTRPGQPQQSNDQAQKASHAINGTGTDVDPKTRPFLSPGPSPPARKSTPLPPVSTTPIVAGGGPAGSSPTTPAQITVPGSLPTTGPVSEPEEVVIITEYSWRNFFSTINFLKILQKMTKHRSHRTYMLNQYKSSQMLKRMLRVNQPMMQLQVLKLIKSQMPWCGRKWRQTNMKVITAIYLNCRPELRDEWLAGQDQDIEMEDALPQETALRALVQFYNKRHYPALTAVPGSPEPSHRRTDSTSAVTLDDPAIHPRQANSGGLHPRSSSSSESDSFPPRRTDSAGASLPYNPDGMIEFWLHEYEDVLGEVFGEGEALGDWEDLGIPASSPRRPSYGSPGYIFGGQQYATTAGGPGTVSPGSPGSGEVPGPKAAERDDRAWNALEEIMGNDDDGISDSESIVSVGELGEEARMEDPQAAFGRMQRRRSENENTWAEMAEKTLAKLPRSPAERRRSSSSGQHASPLRPIINPDGRIQDIDVFAEDEDMPGPMPIERETADERERDFGAVDEVEYAYGE